MNSKYLIAGLLLASTQVNAADEVPPWAVSAELGAITTSGNTQGTSITGKVDAKQETEHWSNEYIASAFFKEDQKTTDSGEHITEKSAEKYLISAKGGYKLDSDHATLFVLGSHTRDQFGAYLDYSLLAAGYGDQLYSGDDLTIDAEIGPGYFKGKTAEDERQNGMMLRGAAALNWKISSSATFRQNVSYELASGNKRSIAESSLSTKINGSMQMKAAFLIQHDSVVPVGKKSTDTQTSLTLVYSF